MIPKGKKVRELIIHSAGHPSVMHVVVWQYGAGLSMKHVVVSCWPLSGACCSVVLASQ